MLISKIFGEEIEIAMQFLENLEDDDDVQNIYTNLKIGNN